MPVTPSTIRSSLVNVPVLSKQQMSNFPANGIRNGSVQKIPNLAKDTNEELTASANSIGNSGGITDVSISVHSSKSL